MQSGNATGRKRAQRSQRTALAQACRQALNMRLTISRIKYENARRRYWKNFKISIDVTLRTLGAMLGTKLKILSLRA